MNMPFEKKTKTDDVTSPAELKAKAKDDLLREAETLGLTRSRTNTTAAKVKDLELETRRHEDFADKRLAKGIEKVKAKETDPQKARKSLLLARLRRKAQPMITLEQARQYRWELRAMKDGTWTPNMKMRQTQRGLENIDDPAAI